MRMSKENSMSVDSENKDLVFAQDMKPHDFAFDDRVAKVFDDMVSRSVPMYRETQAAAIDLAGQFIQPNSRVYDFGCSTATLLLNLAQRVEKPNVRLIGIDNSDSMLAQARKKLDETEAGRRIELQCASVESDCGIEDASVVFMAYTLQFIRPLHREAVVERIYNGLRPNGCFILIEKILGNDSLFNRLYIDLYYQYKATVGYSDKEIRQKRESLENVLIPYRIDENFELLKRCGFTSTDTFFRWFNWAGVVAVKG